ncbi:MAG: phosphoglycolate phosphatase [Rubrivivax sp.]|nr:phosphoglycolate phosphatase [Rubrivivax sp.]
MNPPAAVLFDLDGTLIDSAPDLAAAANAMRSSRGLPAVPYEHLRPMAGSGARGMLLRAFELTPADEGYAALRDEFHDRYERVMLQTTRVFAGIEPVLAQLAQAGVRWGIVTNKSRRFAGPMVQALTALSEAATVVCGDCTPFTKPHPAPLLEAARRLSLDPAHCVYVGDDARDVQAGHAANMATVAAAWGYLGPGADVQAWRAHHVLASPAELLNCLDLA